MSHQLFCDESGINGDSKVLAVGLISTTSQNRRNLLRIIEQARRETGCHNEMHLKHMSNRRFALYARIVTETLDSLRFYVGVINKADIDLKWFGKEDYIALNYFTKKVICRFVRPGLDAVLYLDSKTREKRDNGLQYILREVNFEKPYALKVVEAIDSKASEYMQVCDLYTGLARLAYLRGVTISKNCSWSFTPTNRKEELLCMFLEAYTGMSGKQQKHTGRVWVWQPKANPAQRHQASKGMLGKE